MNARLVKIKRSKFHNVRIEVDGLRFDSKKEYKRYTELKLLERAGVIRDLRLQVPFELLPAQPGGLRSERPLAYVADFVYFDKKKNKQIIEDTKGVKTDLYIIKRKLMKFMGNEIVEV